MPSKFINVADLEVSRVQPDASFVYGPIKYGPYVSDRFEYETYQEQLARCHYAPKGEVMNEMSWVEFRALVIDTFRIQDPKIKLTIGTNEVLDGQHRVSALYLKFKHSAMVEVNDEGEVIALWVRSSP